MNSLRLYQKLAPLLEHHISPLQSLCATQNKVFVFARSQEESGYLALQSNIPNRPINPKPLYLKEYEGWTVDMLYYKISAILQTITILELLKFQIDVPIRLPDIFHFPRKNLQNPDYKLFTEKPFCMFVASGRGKV